MSWGRNCLLGKWCKIMPSITPNLFIVGQPKSGTSALFSFLRQHPDISACEIKEPQYFCSDINSQYFYLSKTPRSIENYLALFPCEAAHYHLEASTSYLFSKKAAENIYKENPEAKIIIMLREPVDFLFTYHRQLLRNSCKFEVEEDFLTALSLEGERRAGRSLPIDVFDEQFLMYSERVHYVEHIKRYTNIFPQEQIKIILYDDFKKDNVQTFRSVLDFLSLPSDLMPEVGVVNKQVAVRNRALKQFLDKAFYPLKMWLKARVSKESFHRLRDYYRKIVFSSAPLAVLSESDRSRLKCDYVEEVKALSEFLDRDLIEEWGYRDI